MSSSTPETAPAAPTRGAAAAAMRGDPPAPWPAARGLRDWQQRALEQLLASPEGSFLASATPAAGKTTFGLAAAHALLSAGAVARVVVAAPTTHIARQWASAGAAVGLALEPNRPNAEGSEPRDRRGVAVTYQTIAAGPALHRRACAARPTLLIADEPHHMGELASWGRSAGEAFAPARLRLLLSGTPFRSDDAAIPWVRYDEDGISRADFAYGYTDALLDGVCRPITFLTYDGEMEWVSDGRTRSAGFDVALPRAEAARRLRTALHAGGEWVGRVLRDADARLSDVRAGGQRDAGGLVIAASKQHAQRLARRLERICGEDVEVVTSDEPDASRRIDAYAASTRRWLVSVLMVSEGVDIPRLRVGVYATAARTELFFRQVVGRFVRRAARPRRQMSYLLMPADATLKDLAARVEEERRHAIDRDGALADGEPPEVARSESEGEGFTALSSSAHLDDVILSSTAPGEALQLFAEPQAAPHAALAAFGGPIEARRPPAGAQCDDDPPRAGAAAHELRERLRGERSRLVARLARATGESHGEINARANRAAGARSVAAATDAQLDAANRALASEIARRRT